MKKYTQWHCRFRARDKGESDKLEKNNASIKRWLGEVTAGPKILLPKRCKESDRYPPLLANHSEITVAAYIWTFWNGLRGRTPHGTEWRTHTLSYTSSAHINDECLGYMSWESNYSGDIYVFASYKLKSNRNVAATCNSLQSRWLPISLSTEIALYLLKFYVKGKTEGSQLIKS